MIRTIKSLLTRTYAEWSDHDAPTLGASLAYYTVLSLAPLLVIATAIAGLAFPKETVQNQILNQVRALMGSTGAEAVRAMLTAQAPRSGVVAIVIGVVALLFGASGVFRELRKALHLMWEVTPTKTSGWLVTIKEQLLSFGMVVGIGFLLLVSLLASAMVAGMGKLASTYVPAGAMQTVSACVSVVAVTILFALIYRFAPQRTLPWKKLWPGSLAAALLFTMGKELLGLYLGRVSVGSAYGAAGSLIVLLVWVYYSSQLFLFGAEFTRIFAGDPLATDSPAPRLRLTTVQAESEI